MIEQSSTADRTPSSLVQIWKYNAANQLKKIKAAPGIKGTGYTDLADFIHHLTPRKPVPGEPIVIAVNGKPGVGKTYTTTFITNYLNLDREAEKVTWEGSERAALDSKAVVIHKPHRKDTPKPNKGVAVVSYGDPWPDKALRIAEETLNQQLSYAVINARHFLVAEIPARGVRRKDGTFIGRSLGMRVLEKLLYREARFKNHYYQVGCVGLIAGVSLEEFSERYREEKKAADTFVKGIRVQSLYGQPLPQSPDEWKKMRSDGATLPQMKKIESADKEAIAALEEDGLIHDLPPEEFDDLFNQYAREEVERYGFDEAHARERFSRALKDAQRYQDVYGRWLSLKKNAFIGYNNPTVVDMVGGDEKKAEELSKRWKSGVKIIPMQRDTWHQINSY